MKSTVCLTAINYSHKIASSHMNYAFKDNVWQHIAALIICPANDICMSASPLSSCVGACSRISPVWLSPAGPAWEHTDKDTQTHTHTHIQSCTWGNMNKPTSKIHLFLMHVWWDRQAAAGHCSELQHRLVCMTRWKQSRGCGWCGWGTYSTDKTWGMCWLFHNSVLNDVSKMTFRLMMSKL